MSISGGEKELRLSCAKTSVFLSSEIAMSWNFLRCIKGVKYRFEFLRIQVNQKGGSLTCWFVFPSEASSLGAD